MTEQELERGARRRLAVIRHAQEVSHNVSKTCRYYGISRNLYYKWYRRYEEEGVAGLRDRSRRPLTRPNATDLEVIGKILYLRENYHFGPLKISMYLNRYHAIEISQSGVWRILKRVGMNRLPASQRHKRHEKRWQRYEKPLPGHQVQIDVKFIEPLKGSRKKRYYQFTAIDDCPRLRILHIYDRCNQKTAIQFADFVLEKLPFEVRSIQTDIQDVCALGSTVRPAGDGKLSGDRCPLRIAADRSERLTTPCPLGVSRAGATPGMERPVRYSVTGLGRIPVGECPARPPRWRHPSVPTRQGGTNATADVGRRYRLSGGPPGQPGRRQRGVPMERPPVSNQLGGSGDVVEVPSR